MQQGPRLPPQPPPARIAPGGVYPVVPATNTLAIVSLGLGIAAYFALPVAGAIAAIITGHIARGQIRRTGEGGDGMAIAGLILGYVHVGLAVIVIVAIIAAIAILGLFATTTSH